MQMGMATITNTRIKISDKSLKMHTWWITFEKFPKSTWIYMRGVKRLNGILFDPAMVGATE